MKKLNKSFLAALLCFITVSCDSFLTTPPLDQLSEATWWKNKEQVEMMVLGCYNYIPGAERVINECWSDNATYRHWQKAVGNGTFDSSDGSIAAEWKYGPIAKLNTVLEGLEKTKSVLTEDQYRTYSSEIRFIRASIYYNMLFYFGDIPLITKVLSVEESRETSRQPRAEVLKFVLDEMNYALENIEAVPNTMSGRVNKSVVLAMLSRICLYEKMYDKVETYTGEIINSGKYELHPSYDELFRPQFDGNNKEVIFERQYKRPISTHGLYCLLSYWKSGYRGWSELNPLESLVDEYECIDGHPTSKCQELGCKYYQMRIDADGPEHRGEYDFRDPRLAATIMWPWREWRYTDGSLRCVFEVDKVGSADCALKEVHTSGYTVTKWVDKDGIDQDRFEGEKNITLLRYGDVLLMRAEALIESNKNLEEAVSLINQIRTRAGMPNIALGSQEELRAKLRHERRVETAFEGLRYKDIIRWRIAKEVKSGNIYGAKLRVLGDENKLMNTRFWEDHMYLFPIPQNAIDNNPNLTQNPGY